MPHFEELPVAKTYSKTTTPLSPTAVKPSPSKDIAILVEEVTTVLSSLELKRNQNVEIHENLSSDLESYDDDVDEFEDSTSDSDEGYESETSDLKQHILTASTKAKAAVSPPSFDLTHALDTCPKTQHFAKTLTVHALHPVSTLEAGQIIARYINIPFLTLALSPTKSKGAAKTKAKAKVNSKANFYTSIEDLNSCNSDGLAFAKALLCPKGKLLARYKSSPARYLGPWGAELESSAVLVVKYLYVDKAFRRQGIARLLLNSLVGEIKERMSKSKDGKGKVKFVVVFPAVIKEDFAAELEGKTEAEKMEIEEREYANAVGAYRALGFRRIGMSKWFGLALEEGHASRGLAVEDDLDPEDENEN